MVRAVLVWTDYYFFHQGHLTTSTIRSSISVPRFFCVIGPFGCWRAKKKTNAMKKLIFIIMISLAALTMQAQRCAVLEFKAGVGISQNDVDGISAIFITYFRPAGYTMVERTQIDKVIEEQGFQRSSMTQSQMVRVGQILNVSKIVVGDINVVMGQYNVDCRVLNVETGTIAATEGATFATSSYRSSMQNVAQKLAAKIAITSGGTVQLSSPSQERNTPFVIYDYLKVFPKDLGTFDAEPKTVIARLNQSQQYGYGTWRLPTNEELALMRANNVIGSGNYMSKENPTGIVRLVTDKEKGEILPSVPIGFIDLGLPSGTLWKAENENGFYDYVTAVRSFGNKLPTAEQLKELKNSCQWTWTGNGYKVIGPSGEFITLTALGWRLCDGFLTGAGYGEYWSTTSSDSDASKAWSLGFSSSKVSVGESLKCCRRSVLLIHD